MFKIALPKHKEKILFLFGAILSIAFAIPFRVPHLTDLFWQADYQYHYNLLASQHFKDFGWALVSQLQPCLDYVLRKVFWLPLLGYHERSLRIPVLFYSLFHVFLIFLFTYRLRVKEKLLSYSNQLFFLIPSLFLALSSFEENLMTDSRHYTFIGLMSLVWCWFFLNSNYFGKEKDQNRKWLYVFTIAFFNTYFFSLFLISGALLFDFFSSKKNYNGFLKKSAILVGLLAFSALVLNRQAFISLFHGTGSNTKETFLVLKETGSLYFKYLSFGFIGYWGIALFPLPILGAFLVPRLRASLRTPMMKLGILIFIMAPIFLFIARLKSDYPFSDRYFAFLMGPLELWLVYCLISLALILKKNKNFFIVLLAVYFLGPFCKSFYHSIASHRFGKLTANPSNAHQSYKELTELNAPLFVLDDCDSIERGLFYLRYNLNGIYPFGYQVADFCYFTNKELLPRIDYFFKIFKGNGVFVFDQYRPDRICKPQARHFSTKSGSPIVLTKTQGSACIWYAKGIQSFSDLKSTMDSISFFYNKKL